MSEPGRGEGGGRIPFGCEVGRRGSVRRGDAVGGVESLRDEVGGEGVLVVRSERGERGAKGPNSAFLVRGSLSSEGGEMRSLQKKDGVRGL